MQSEPEPWGVPEGATSVRVADAAALADQLRGFAGDAEAVAADDDGVAVTAGSATLTVATDGTVTASTPRGEFHASGVETVVVDHDRGAVGVATPDGDVCYEFRRPE